MVARDENERRRAERIPINAEFATLPAATYISDLSELGVFVHTTTMAPMGSTLKLRFTVLLDDPIIVEAKGRVVRHQHGTTPGMGIEFTDLSPEMTLKINDAVSRQRPRDSGPPLTRLPPDPDDEPEVSDTAATLQVGRRFTPPPPPPGKKSASSRGLDEAKTTHYPVLSGVPADDSE